MQGLMMADGFVFCCYCMPRYYMAVRLIRFLASLCLLSACLNDSTNRGKIG